jgi:hypothetical protein
VVQRTAAGCASWRAARARSRRRRPDAYSARLQARGFRTYVLPVRKRKEWLRVGRALFTRAFWRSDCTTDPGYTW